ncbi:hypothetical protein QE152_g29682 [Popillia japonica]|uniref:Uncharacterized protein n=1 Tax=Popillia japonica TaxID=7064 RepID=A0AAW1JGQ4_POPJA
MTGPRRCLLCASIAPSASYDCSNGGTRPGIDDDNDNDSVAITWGCGNRMNVWKEKKRCKGWRKTRGLLRGIVIYFPLNVDVVIVEVSASFETGQGETELWMAAVRVEVSACFSGNYEPLRNIKALAMGFSRYVIGAQTETLRERCSEPEVVLGNTLHNSTGEDCYGTRTQWCGRIRYMSCGKAVKRRALSPHGKKIE